MSRVILIVIAIIALTAVSVKADGKCSDQPSVKNSHNAFIDAYKNEIRSILRGNTYNRTQFMSVLVENSKHLLEAVNTTCKLNTTGRDFSKFIDLVDFSLNNTSLIKDLHKNKGLECIWAKKTNLTACVTAKVKENHNGNRTKAQISIGKLMRKSKFVFNSLACTNNKHIKSGIVNTLKGEEKCNATEGYVSSLFDHAYALGHCENILKTVQQTEPKTSGAGNPFGIYATFALNAVLCGLIIG